MSFEGVKLSTLGEPWSPDIPTRSNSQAALQGSWHSVVEILRKSTHDDEAFVFLKKAIDGNFGYQKYASLQYRDIDSAGKMESYQFTYLVKQLELPASDRYTAIPGKIELEPGTVQQAVANLSARARHCVAATLTHACMVNKYGIDTDLTTLPIWPDRETARSHFYEHAEPIDKELYFAISEGRFGVSNALEEFYGTDLLSEEEEDK